ncbi:DNA-binding protein [Lichenibacterium minor]|uniref:DNA-binding protein n=1 Tax=Lichenibacterium minor TaxID=2316528 RepID=A0A4Q2UB42_9HYPH|nr:helix-turn-helix domain-containing protein [Lichenibacterium minor]RYC33880.1 DNA-binding protein [Lichenibacterium minor]
MRNDNEQDTTGRVGLSVDEACHVAGIGKTRMYELLRSGSVPARRIGRRIIILRSDLLAWMDALPRWEPEGT